MNCRFGDGVRNIGAGDIAIRVSIKLLVQRTGVFGGSGPPSEAYRLGRADSPSKPITSRPCSLHSSIRARISVP